MNKSSSVLTDPPGDEHGYSGDDKPVICSHWGGAIGFLSLCLKQG